jgi:hypothetical protein
MISWYRLAQEAKQSDVDDELLEIFDKDPWQDVDSSFIDAIAYYDLAQVLEVRIANGRVYTFMEVPPEIHKAFLKSPSKGSFFNKIIRKDYVYKN